MQPDKNDYIITPQQATQLLETGSDVGSLHIVSVEQLKAVLGLENPHGAAEIHARLPEAVRGSFNTEEGTIGLQRAALFDIAGMRDRPSVPVLY
jgi:hypothetical protein